MARYCNSCGKIAAGENHPLGHCSCGRPDFSKRPTLDDWRRRAEKAEAALQEVEVDRSALRDQLDEAAGRAPELEDLTSLLERDSTPETIGNVVGDLGNLADLLRTLPQRVIGQHDEIEALEDRAQAAEARALSAEEGLRETVAEFETQARELRRRGVTPERAEVWDKAASYLRKAFAAALSNPEGREDHTCERQEVAIHPLAATLLVELASGRPRSDVADWELDSAVSHVRAALNCTPQHDPPVSGGGGVGEAGCVRCGGTKRVSEREGPIEKWVVGVCPNCKVGEALRKGEAK